MEGETKRYTSNKVDEADVEDINIVGDEVDVEDANLEDIHLEDDVSDYLNNDSDLGGILLKDGSDVDKELGALRQERKNDEKEIKKQGRRLLKLKHL